MDFIRLNWIEYCYGNRNDLISFNIKYNKRTKIMTVKRIDDNNATRGNVYTIYANESIEHVNQQQ